MTAYVYTPLCPVPAPVQSGTSAGWYNATVWGAGIRAGTHPIRITKVESFTLNNVLNMYRVDTATFNNSTVIPAIVPPALRQGANPCSATTGLSTALTFFNGSSYSFSISGTVPSGTFRYLDTCPAASGASPPGVVAISPGVFSFSPGILIQPGSAFWIGSNTTAALTTVGGTTYVYYNGGAVASAQANPSAPGSQTFSAANIVFDEVRLQPSY